MVTAKLQITKRRLDRICNVCFNRENVYGKEDTKWHMGAFSLTAKKKKKKKKKKTIQIVEKVAFIAIEKFHPYTFLCNFHF